MITTIDGRHVASMDAVVAAVDGHKPGDSIQVDAAAQTATTKTVTRRSCGKRPARRLPRQRSGAAPYDVGRGHAA